MKKISYISGQKSGTVVAQEHTILSIHARGLLGQWVMPCTAKVGSYGNRFDASLASY